VHCKTPCSRRDVEKAGLAHAVTWRYALTPCSIMGNMNRGMCTLDLRGDMFEYFHLIGI